MSTRHIQGFGSSAGDAATELARIKGDTVGTGPILYDAVDGIVKYYDRVNSVVRQLAALNPAPVSITANLTLSNALHAGRQLFINAAAGLSALVLPAATGSGDVYRLLVGTLLTSNAIVIDVTSPAKFYGGVNINDSGDTTPLTDDFFPAVNGTSVKITLTASIGAGKIGDWIEITDVAADKWAVSGQIQGETDPTNPFS
jgi:hypothetical protein